MYRLSLPALLVVGVYLLALAIVAVLALVTGDLDAMLRLTLIPVTDEEVPVTRTNLIILVLVGGMWAWTLWQGLRGPLTGPPPAADRDITRLRIALYVAAASWLIYPVSTFWTWWIGVLDAVVMLAVVWLFHPVLTRGDTKSDHMRTIGVAGYVCVAIFEVLDGFAVDLPGPLLLGGLAALVWTVLLLRAQRNDSLWQTSTVVYGIASLVLMIISGLLDRLVESVGDVPSAVSTCAGALTLIWLARSAHDLANPRHEPAPSPPVAAES
ncbi:hypothetical protein ACIBEJ_45165 [Nonomuraea sp. NPDC050790]|uniref:hypothetical protein n=1 Tax=Nonomuraea sp. NPDC050790 TaxID=3364371 RepID=UPI003789D4D0